MKFLKKIISNEIAYSENPYGESNRDQITKTIIQLINTGTANLNQISNLFKTNRISKISVFGLRNILEMLQQLDNNMKSIIRENQSLNR